MDFFTNAWNWVTGSGVTSSLAKLAVLGYASRLIGGNTDPNANQDPAQPDTGVRLQLDPSTDNQIPVLYGEAYFGGNITDAQLSSDYKKMTYCLTLAEQTGQKLSDNQYTGFIFKNVYINNNRVIFKADGFTVDYIVDASGNQDISLRDLVKIYFYVNGGLQPEGYSGTTPADYTVMPGWNSTDYPMTDLIYSIVEVTYNRDKGVSGLPELIFHVDTNMKKPGDVLLDYMTNTVYGAGIPLTEIGSTLIDLNTYADTGFSYTNTLNQTVTSPITINGLVDTTQPVLDNMKKLADAAGAWINYDIYTGKWNVTINKTGSSVASLSDSNIIGDIAISGTSLVQLNNAVNTRYQNTDILDKTDFVKITLPTGDWYANEPESTLELDLPFTNSQVVAAKIGLLALKQARVDKIIQFQTDYSYINLKAGDLIDVTSSVYGFTNKMFRIITVSESEGDSGSIQISFTALEYDAAVYSYNITEYTVETDGGIFGIGSIGKPNTPTVTKTEQSNSPRIVINAVVPSGIVDAMEYWITFDTSIQNDANRSYIQIGRLTNTNGSLLAENTTLSYTYSGLAQSDFYVKVRATNGVTSGPYSDPSGLIAYVPIVVADTISNNPVSVGGQLMSLGLLTLLNNMDKLFQGDTSPGGLFDKIFSAFETKTGVDLVGQAEGGTMTADITVRDEGTTITTTTSVLNFVGDGVVATADGTNVTVTIGGSTGGTGGTGGTSQCYISVAEYYPKRRGSQSNSVPGTDQDPWGSDVAPTKGSYYLRFSGVVGALVKGTGTAKLYKTNGTLASTVNASSVTINNDVVEIPFSNRDTGTDYYVLLSDGFVTNNGCLSPAITDPEGWYFNTPLFATYATTVVGTSQVTPDYCGPLSYTGLWLEAGTTGNTTPNTTTNINRQSWIGIAFNRAVKLTKSGTISIVGHEQINIAETFVSNKVAPRVWVSGQILYINPTKDMAAGGTYTANISSGVVSDLCGKFGNTEITTVSWVCSQGPIITAAALPSTGSVNENGVVLNSSTTMTPGTGSAYVYDSNGTLVSTVASNNSAVTFTTT